MVFDYAKQMIRHLALGSEPQDHFYGCTNPQSILGHQTGANDVSQKSLIKSTRSTALPLFLTTVVNCAMYSKGRSRVSNDARSAVFSTHGGWGVMLTGQA